MTSLFASAAVAQSGGAVGPFSFGPSISTLGVGVEAGYRATDLVGLRLDVNGLDFGGHRVIDTTPYAYNARPLSAGPSLDFYPFAGGLRVTAGARWNGNHLIATSTPTGSITVGGTTLTPAQIGTLNGRVGFSSFAPYLGLGFAAGALGPLQLAADLGVMYEGAPKVSLVSTSPLAGTPSVQNALATETRDIAKKADLLEWYPVLTVTASYLF